MKGAQSVEPYIEQILQISGYARAVLTALVLLR